MRPVSKLDDLYDAAKILVAAEERARVRLSDVRGRKFYVAMLGLHTEFDSFEFGDPALLLRRIEEGPHETALARVLTEPSLWGVVGRYARAMTHELVIDREPAKDDQTALNLARFIVSALRARTLAEFLVPAVATYPWAAMAGLKSAECDVRLIEDVPLAKRLAPTKRVELSEAQWVSDNLLRFIDLLQDPAYRIAVDALTTHQHEATERTMTAILWAGIEALFKAKVETTFRVSAYVAAYLEPAGQPRLALFQRLKKLYAIRSQAVHGEAVSAARLREHILEVRRLLSRVVCKAAESGRVPTPDAAEVQLFLGP